MNNVQYTIRQVPKQLDTELRRQAQRRGRSLNQTVLDYISRAVADDRQAANDDLSWFIGANTIDETALDAIREAKQTDKNKQH